MLYDVSDMEGGGANTEGDTAAMQQGTRRCVACHLADLLPCLGGVAALLPLFAQLGRFEGSSCVLRAWQAWQAVGCTLQAAAAGTSCRAALKRSYLLQLPDGLCA